MKKNKQIRQHQRQRVSGKTIFIICAVSFCCLAICSTILFNIVHVDHSMATGQEQDANVRVIQEQSWIIEKEIPVPVIKQQEINSSNTLFARKSKVQTTVGSSAH